MKAILEEYGQIILAMVIVLLMIGFAPSISQAVKDKWNGSIDQLIAKDNGGSTQQPQQPQQPPTPPVEPEPTETNYTMEQINADPNLFAIGETLPEYVVAKFSADGKKAVITKNGVMSDGLMKNWSGTSIFTQKEAGLEIVNIKEGIKNIGDNAFCYCNSMTNVSLPNTIESIGMNSYRECKKIQNVYIPKSVTFISFAPWAYCPLVTTIKCEAPSQPSGWYPTWNITEIPVNWGVPPSNNVG